MLGLKGLGRQRTIGIILFSPVLAYLAACGNAQKVTPPAQQSGVSAELVAKAQLPDGFAITTEGPSVLGTVDIKMAAGQDNGWHSHSGPVLVAVKKGTASLYYGDDPTCTVHRLSAGRGFFEPKGRVHIVRNEGKAPLELYATYVVPADAAPGIPEKAPGNCPF
jgi:quercetin dioxygenase-like cupin family protein